MLHASINQFERRLQYDNADLLGVKPAKKFLEALRSAILTQSQHLPHVAFSDYHLFPSMQSTNLQEQFNYYSEIQNQLIDLIPSNNHTTSNAAYYLKDYLLLYFLRR